MAFVPNTKENIARCVCPTCPTYTADDCPKEKQENIFCAVGKSGCGLADRGCLCGNCPLWDEYKLTKGSFCIRGAAI
jgi:hypothetical protein